MNNERALYQDIPVGKFHSAVLTSYTFDIAHFDNQVLNLLRGKRICSYNILVDQKQLTLPSLSTWAPYEK